MTLPSIQLSGNWWELSLPHWGSYGTTLLPTGDEALSGNSVPPLLLASRLPPQPYSLHTVQTIILYGLRAMLEGFIQ